MEATDRSDISALRTFNRVYTQKLGLLNSRLDGSPFTLTEARILYEVAHQMEPTAAGIMRTLGLDRGQLSRTLKRFADRGLIETSPHAEGGRRRVISLTAEGRKVFAGLEQKTHAAVGSLLDDLKPQRRAALVKAARDLTGIFEANDSSGVVLRGLRPGDIGWITHRQAVIYAEEYGWNGEYEALAARILADFVDAFDPAHDAAWVAELDGRVVGSVFLVRGGMPKTGKLRLLYVEPSVRGARIGSRLVDACVARAREAGDERLVLWTNSVLSSARHIYERAGFRLVEEAPHHSFGKDLVGQTWELHLGAGSAADDA